MFNQFIGEQGMRGFDGRPGIPGENARPSPKGEKGKHLNDNNACVARYINYGFKIIKILSFLLFLIFVSINTQTKTCGR